MGVFGSRRVIREGNQCTSTGHEPRLLRIGVFLTAGIHYRERRKFPDFCGEKRLKEADKKGYASVAVDLEAVGLVCAAGVVDGGQCVLKLLPDLLSKGLGFGVQELGYSECSSSSQMSCQRV
jgi:hypothetical protein